jgi:hypothetical protein
MREWVIEIATKAYSFALPLYSIALAVAIFALIPLAIWRRTRGAAGVGLMVTSYIFGLTTWLLGTAVTFGSFGWLGIIIGLLVFGVGVVPLAIIGAIFKLENGGMAMALFGMAAVTLAARFGGAYASSKAKTSS